MARKHYRQAVAAKCVDCFFDPLAGGTKYQQVAACSAFSCPLWPVRPLSGMSDTLYVTWPEKTTLNVMSTLGITRETAERWRENPLEKPPVQLSQ